MVLSAIARYLLAVLTLLAAIFPAHAAEPARYGGEIRIAINSDILSTNPGVLRDGNTDTVHYHIGESLVAYRNDLTVAPLLAEKIDISTDYKTFTFTLRRGVRCIRPP